MKNSLSLRFVRNAIVAVAVMAASTMMSQEANAQSCNRGGGYGGYSGGHHSGSFNRGYPSYNRSGFSLSISNGFDRGGSFYYSNPVRNYSYRPSTWHNTSHYDYNPGRHVRHGNHYDYIPGHYNYHRTGHWHH